MGVIRTGSAVGWPLRNVGGDRRARENAKAPGLYTGKPTLSLPRQLPEPEQEGSPREQTSFGVCGLLLPVCCSSSLENPQISVSTVAPPLPKPQFSWEN